MKFIAETRAGAFIHGIGIGILMGWVSAAIVALLVFG